MSGPGAGCVVVGIDPGGRSDDVVRTAAREAERRGAELVIVAVARHSQDVRHTTAGLTDDDWAGTVARRALDDARDRLGDLAGRLRVTAACVWRDEVTTDPSLARAELLVLGSRGRHGQRAFGLSSVSRVLLKAVRCPVLAVPPGHDPRAGDNGPAGPAGPAAPVVAGVGDHPGDAAVLGTALREAERRGTGLDVVHAYVARSDQPPAHGERRAADRVAAVIEALGATRAPSVHLTPQPPAAALVARSREASLVVVGSRPGALSGLVLESVSHAVLAAAACPVLVVPRDQPAAVTLPPDGALRTEIRR